MNQRDFDMMQLEAQSNISRLVQDFYQQWFLRGQPAPAQDEFVDGIEEEELPAEAARSSHQMDPSIRVTQE